MQTNLISNLSVFCKKSAGNLDFVPFERIFERNNQRGIYIYIYNLEICELCTKMSIIYIILIDMLTQRFCKMNEPDLKFLTTKLKNTDIYFILLNPSTAIKISDFRFQSDQDDDNKSCIHVSPDNTMALI